jgi:uncharacterized damage-inducible protein DinB
MPGNVPSVEGERRNLLAYLEQQRNGVRLTAFGLTDEQARSTPTASALSIGGLIKHVTATERSWMRDVLQLGVDDDGEAQYGESFAMRPEDTLAAILDDNERCGRETEEIIAGIADLGQPVPVPKDVPWFPKDVESWEVRWVLLHLIEELARHAGHADILREHIDGGTMYPIMAAAEHWPESPWMQPWKPTGDQIVP